MVFDVLPEVQVEQTFFVQIFRALYGFGSFTAYFFYNAGLFQFGALSDITRNGVRVFWVLKIVHSSALKWGEFQVYVCM